MLVSRLIKELEEVQKKYGNLPVRYADTVRGDRDVREVSVYTESGHDPEDSDEPASEIFLWGTSLGVDIEL